MLLLTLIGEVPARDQLNKSYSANLVPRAFTKGKALLLRSTLLLLRAGLKW